LRFFAQFFLSNSVILVRLVLILTGGKNGNQTTEIIRNETRYKMMVEMVQFNFGEKKKNTLNLWPNFEERAPVEILDIIWLF